MNADKARLIAGAAMLAIVAYGLGYSAGKKMDRECKAHIYDTMDDMRMKCGEPDRVSQNDPYPEYERWIYRGRWELLFNKEGEVYWFTRL